MRPPARTGPLLSATVALAVGATGCAVGLERLPLPSPGLGSGAYSVTATFADALNLPTKAKVELNGADVGEVVSMTARDYTAVVTLRIRADVSLPVGTGAELRSATPMGDVFVALHPPADPDPAAGLLGDGAVIPIEDTAAAATVEETLSRAALLVGGGAVENLTEVVTALGEYLAGRGERLAALVEQTRRLLDSIAHRSEEIRGVVSGAADLGNTLAAQQDALTEAVAAASPAMATLAENTDGLVELVSRIHTVTEQLGRFPSVQGTNEGSMIEDVDGLAAGLSAAATNPEADLDALNSIIATVVKLTSASSSHVVVDVAQLAVGAVPDPNFPGTPGARLPDATDWAAFAGSLHYMLERLGERVNEAPR